MAVTMLEKTYRWRRSTQSIHVWRVQFSQQRVLFQQKYINHWSCTIDSCHGNSKALSSKLRVLLQPELGSCSHLIAGEHAHYFVAKIDGIRALTATSLPPNIIDRFVSEPLVDLRPATADEVASILKRSDPKQCLLDAAPTWPIKHVGDFLAPVIARMCNASFNQVKLPDRSKKAIVRVTAEKANA